MKRETGKLVTLDDIPKIDYNTDDYQYQPDLTKLLEQKQGRAVTQETINEIVLWKINRYAAFPTDVLSLINTIPADSLTLDEAKSQTVLERLLGLRGVGLPMASTVLRCRNSKIYQIIDQRAFRIIYGNR